MDASIDFDDESSYYKALGVNPNSSDHEIKKAIFAKARLCHPDKSDHPKAEEAMKYLNRAREVLLDSEKKIRYDEQLVDKDPAGTTTEDLITLPASQRLSASLMTFQLWEQEFTSVNFCKLAEDLCEKLHQLTLKYSLPFKPTPPQATVQKSSLQKLLEECKKPQAPKPKTLVQQSSSASQTGPQQNASWIDLMCKSSKNDESLYSDAQYVLETLAELVNKLHKTESARKLSPIDGKVLIIDISCASIGDLQFLMQLFIGCSLEEAKEYPRRNMLLTISAFIPVVKVQPPKRVVNNNGRCTSCSKVSSAYCLNCAKALCSFCIVKRRVCQLNMHLLQTTCNSCNESLNKQGAELWKEKGLELIRAGDSRSLVASHGCMSMALSCGMNSNDLLCSAADAFSQQGHHKTSIQFLTSTLQNCIDSEPVKTYMSIAADLESLSEQPQSKYITKLAYLMAAKNVYASVKRITDVNPTIISVQSLSKNTKILEKKVHALYSSEKETRAGEVCQKLNTAWATQDFKKMASMLNPKLDDELGSHFGDYAIVGLERFLSNKDAKLMPSRDKAAMIFLQGALKLLKGEQSGLFDVEDAIWKGYHSDWMPQASIDILMTRLQCDTGNITPYKKLQSIWKDLKVDDILSNNSKCLALLSIQIWGDFAPPTTRHWPEFFIDGINSKATCKYEHTAIRMFQEGKYTANDVALAYLDYLSNPEHPAEVCTSFLLAGFWFFKDLEDITKKESTRLEKIYSTKRAIMESIEFAFRAAQEHFHLGMQLYISRLGLQIVLATRKYALPYFTTADSNLLSQLLKKVIQASRFCPFWNAPVVMACEAPLLHIMTRELHSKFVQSLQPTMSMPFTKPDLKYQLYETNLCHLRDLEDLQAAHVQAMDAMLSEKGWCMDDVTSLLTSPLSPRTKEGWLIQQSNLGVPMEYASLEGFVLDVENPSLDLITVKADANNTGLISQNDVWEFLHLPAGELWFSLDPPDEDKKFHPFQALEYHPKELKGSTILHTMFETDYLLKSFSTGTEVSSIPPFKQRPCSEGLLASLPENLKKILMPVSKRGESRSHKQRFWIQSDELIYDESEKDGKLTVKFKNPNVLIRTHPLMTDVEGKLKDTVEDTDQNSPEIKFAKDLTAHYEEIGKYFPMFARLREIFKLIFLHNVIQSVLEDLQEKAGGKVSIPRRAVEEMQQRQRQDKLKRIDKMLELLKCQYDSNNTARYSRECDIKAQIINHLLEMCQGYEHHDKVETMVGRWLNDQYQAQEDLIDYICNCIEQAVARDHQDVAHQVGYKSKFDQVMEECRQKVSEQVSKLKSDYLQIISKIQSEQSGDHLQIAQQITDHYKGDYTTIEKLMQKWLDSRSGLSELRSYICDQLPSITSDDIKERKIENCKTRHLKLSSFVNYIKGPNTWPTATSTCNWVPAAMVQRETNAGYSMCYGGVLIELKPIQGKVTIDSKATNVPVTPPSNGNHEAYSEPTVISLLQEMLKIKPPPPPKSKLMVEIKNTLDKIQERLQKELQSEGGSVGECVEHPDKPKEQKRVPDNNLTELLAQATLIVSADEHKEHIFDKFEVLAEAAVKNLPCDYELLVTGRWPSHVQQQNKSTDDDDDVYKMSAKPRGIGVIINNKEFNEGPRTGTDVDAAALVKLFTYLGFLTKCYKNLKANKMREVLKEVADLDHANYDCLLVAVLTHGGAVVPPATTFVNSYASLEVLYGIDDESICDSEIVGFFTGNTLNDKPKLFFLQACRGNMIDSGVIVDVYEKTEESSADFLTASPDNRNKKPHSAKKGKKVIPTMSDCLIGYASIPGHLAFRNPETGSIYISALVKVFLENAHNMEILKMMKKVRKTMSVLSITYKDKDGNNENCKQIPIEEQTLQKDLYFNRGPYTTT